MKYELAKELKDAGFPQKNGGFWYSQNFEVNAPYEIFYEGEVTGMYGEEWFSSSPDRGDIKAPTLSELIEECGEADVFELHRERGKWAAYIMDATSERSFKTRVYGEGSTPEEAVARLWLALNTSK